MAAKNGAGVVGLRLNMPGAPAVWHHLPDHGIWVHPTQPIPCGGVLEPSVELAESLGRDPGALVEVVRIPDADVEAARVALENHVRSLRGLPPVEGVTGGEAEVLLAQSNTKEA